jgi:hypothetical protein
MDRKELRVFAVLSGGVYLYDAEKNTLSQVLEGDYTAKYAQSPLTILYAAPDAPYGGVHAGAAAQSAALYCASTGLANVIKTTGTDALGDDLKLPSGYAVLLVQSVGLPG